MIFWVLPEVFLGRFCGKESLEGEIDVAEVVSAVVLADTFDTIDLIESPELPALGCAKGELALGALLGWSNVAPREIGNATELAERRATIGSVPRRKIMDELYAPRMLSASAGALSDEADVLFLVA